MVAMAIMAIVLVSVYRMHSQTLTMNTANRFYTQAPMLAQSKLAQLETGFIGNNCRRFGGLRGKVSRLQLERHRGGGIFRGAG